MRIHALRRSRHEKIGRVIRLAAPAIVGFGVGCSTAPKHIQLESFTVERSWNRNVGDPVLEVPPPAVIAGSDAVAIRFRPTASMERRRIDRRFLVTGSAEVLPGASPKGTSPAMLAELAEESLLAVYPALGQRADATLEPASLELRSVVTNIEGRPRIADVNLEIRPEDAVFLEPAQTPVSVRLASAELVTGEGRSQISKSLDSAVTEADSARLEFRSLDTASCSFLRELLLGRYRVEAEFEIQAGGVSTMERRTFEASEGAEWLDPIRVAARARLEAIAVEDVGGALAIAMSREGDALNRGSSLPAVRLRNSGTGPLLDVRPFTVTYLLREGVGIAFAGAEDSEFEPCLCPGDSIEIIPSEAIDPCGPALAGADGLAVRVDGSGFDRVELGPVAVNAITRGRYQLDPPRTSGGTIEVRATDVGGQGARGLSLRLSRGQGEGSTIETPFPNIPAGGSVSLQLPDGLPEAARQMWNAWNGEGGRVDLLLLEGALWGCDGANPARQAVRLGG